MGFIEERRFFLGLNTDDEDRLLQNGDYRHALNSEIAGYQNSASGSLEKASGNLVVPYALPAGNNYCIGKCRDNDGDRVFFFIHNDLGEHGIYEYNRPAGTVFEIITGSILNFRKENRINHANVVDGKLLYWTDGFNPPRKINIDKAKSFDKKRKFKVYFGKQSSTGESYLVSIIGPSGTVVDQQFVTVPISSEGAYGVSKYLASVLTSFYANFKSCGPELDVDMTQVGEYTVTVYPTNPIVMPFQTVVVPQNFYPQPYAEDYIDRLKYPPKCHPTATYQYDATRNVNLVENRVFQFAVRYIYDDYEKSTLSPISPIPTYQDGCQAASAASNCIDVDFTDPRINDGPQGRLSIIRAVDICFREHNDGKWKIAETLEPAQFGLGTNIYRFYNDGIYRNLSDEDGAKLFDSVPIKCGAQEFIGNRIFDADITEGYDPVCIDAKIDIGYEQVQSSRGFTISGEVSVISQRYGIWSSAQFLRMPIYTYKQSGDPTQVRFGALDQQPGTWTDYKKTVAILDAAAYRQTMPLSGFLFYLAGTNYFGTSRQNPASVTHQDPTTGVLEIDNTRVDSSGDLTDLNQIWLVANSPTGFRSKWEIRNVQPGRYSLRVASHLVTASDVTAGPEIYQGTSTTVATGTISSTPLGIAGTSKNEAIIEVTDTGVVNVYDPDTNVLLYSSTTGQLNESFIQDVAKSQPGAYPNVAFAGYVTDGESTPTPATVSDAMSERRIDKSVVRADRVTLAGTSLSANYSSPTDHNGFFYIVTPGNAAIQSFTEKLQFTDIKTGVYTMNYGAGMDAISSSSWPTAVPFIWVFAMQYVVVRVNNATVTSIGRTSVQGNLLDATGSPVPGAIVVMANAGFAITDASGFWSIVTFNYYQPLSFDERLLIFSTGSPCITSYSYNVAPINIPIGATPDYNNTNPAIITPGPTVSIVTQPQLSAFKRGYDGVFGIVYYDRGNRSTAVNTDQRLKIHVPYYTEIDPSTGLVPSGDVPILNWTINHLPPDWATHYQWVRTKNMQHSFFLEWIADTVEYTNEALETAPTVSYNQGKLVKIGYLNLNTYKEQNGDSLLAYTFVAGDRVRFRATGAGSTYQQYFDFKIEAVDSGYLFFEKSQVMGPIQTGTLLEIYRPRLDTEEKIFFEFGECFEIKTATTGFRYHAGDTQDQTPTQPAQGTFKTGDVWYRTRTIPYNSTGSIQIVPVFVSDPSISDFYDSLDQSIGRINIENRDSRQLRIEKGIRFSNAYVAESFINGLSTFDAGNLEVIDKGEGPVYKLQRSGRVLLAIQQTQVNSVYINEVIFIDASGSQSLTKSDKVIASKNPLRGLYGTINPESVAEYEGAVYFFDKTAGSVIRYASDGLNPVSAYKFRRAIQDKAYEMSTLQRTDTIAIGGFDPENRKYVLSFQKTSQGINFTEATVAFSEPLNRWISYYSYMPECIADIGLEMITFKGGLPWIHSKGATVANYYGQQYSHSVTVVSNQGSEKVRNFMAASTESSAPFHFPSIRVPFKLSEMNTRILPGKARMVEGVYYSVIPKDLNTPNAGADAIVNGRDMRGHTATLTLQNDDTVQVRLHALNVRFIFSELSKQ